MAETHSNGHVYDKLLEKKKKNSVANNMGLSLFAYLLLLPKHEKCREIPREFDLTSVQGHPRSSILVSMESPYVTSY